MFMERPPFDLGQPQGYHVDEMDARQVHVILLVALHNLGARDCFRFDFSLIHQL
jgi:hypothetical protein